MYIIRGQFLINYTCNSHSIMLLFACILKYIVLIAPDFDGFLLHLSVLQLLDCPSAVLGDRGSVMQGDRVCWLLVLLAISSGTLLPSNEPLSAPRVFLSFKGRRVCHAGSQLSLPLILL